MKHSFLLATLTLSGCTVVNAPTAVPSVVPSTPPPEPVQRVVPTWVDPTLVGTMIVMPGIRHWDGGQMHPCYGPGIDTDVARQVMQEVAEYVSVSETQPCNVEWVRMYDPGNTLTVLSGYPDRIISAKIFIRHPDIMSARHEVGHVLGFDHSPRRQDLMNASPRVQEFSSDERAILSWMYR